MPVLIKDIYISCVSHSTYPLSAMCRQLKASSKAVAVQGQDRSITTIQKRPVRPILPAYYNTGEI